MQQTPEFPDFPLKRENELRLHAEKAERRKQNFKEPLFYTKMFCLSCNYTKTNFHT
jgi:hypothetical protein